MSINNQYTMCMYIRLTILNDKICVIPIGNDQSKNEYTNYTKLHLKMSQAIMYTIITRLIHILLH